MKPYWTIILVALAVGTNGQWTHQRLATREDGPIGKTYFLNQKGIAAFTTGRGNVYRNNVIIGRGVVRGINSSGQVVYINDNVWVDNINYSQGLLPPVVGGLFAGGVTADGRPFWSYQIYDDEIFLGRQALGLASLIPGPNRSCYPIAVSETGRMAWNAGSNYAGTGIVFRDKADISSAIMGAAGYGEARDINNTGQTLWDGSKRPGYLPYHVFIDDRNVSSSVLTRSGDQAIARGINQSGDVSWQGVGPSTGGNLDTFLNEFNLSATIYGSRPHYSENFSRPSDAGFLNWNGQDELLTWDTYVNLRNVSQETLGADRLYAYGSGVDDFGRALWEGKLKSEPQGHKHVFIDTFDLTRDVYGSEAPNGRALAVGKNGHVLWAADTGGWQWDYWLSTPVPEPSAWSAFLPIVVCLGLRRRVLNLTWPRRGRVSGHGDRGVVSQGFFMP